jgi:Fe-S oxidoreductase
VPLVGVDPAMTLCYRGEYAHSLGDAAAPPVLLLQEFLAQRLAREAPKPARHEYRLLGHCTERTNAPESLKQWQQVFERFGLGLRIQATGCCGMAGTYGHLRDHRDTSERIYEMSWRPQVAAISPEAPAVATGYSCRAQAKLVDAIVLPHPAQALLAELRRAD